MATHRISFPHLSRGRAPSAERGAGQQAHVGRSEPAEPPFAFGFFLLAPVSFALIVMAIAWISKASF